MTFDYMLNNLSTLFRMSVKHSFKMYALLLSAAGHRALLCTLKKKKKKTFDRYRREKFHI